MSALLETGAERTQTGAATAFVVAAAFVGLAGLPGLAAGATVVAAWYFLPATYAFALGHVALAAAFPAGGLVPIAVVEVGLVALLFVSARSSERPAARIARPDVEGERPETEGERPRIGDRSRRTAAVAVGWLLLGGALAVASSTALLDVSLAAVLLAGVTAFAIYGLHRYQLVALGRVGETRE